MNDKTKSKGKNKAENISSNKITEFKPNKIYGGDV